MLLRTCLALDPRALSSNLVLGVLLGVLPSVAAQERGPAFGQVLDASGKPVPGAQVTCIGSEPLPAVDAEPALADAVDVQADARGRFVARLLPGREYSAWAVDEMTAGGTFRISEMAHGLRIGGSTELKLDATRRRQRAELRGIERWVELAPLRIGRVVFGRHVLAITPDAEGFLPPMPEVHRFVVFDRDWVPLWDGPHSPDQVHERHVFVPAPRRAEVVVRDAKGTPIAGAEIWLEFDVPGRKSLTPVEGWHAPLLPHWFRKLASTDAEGRADVVFPAWTADLHWHLQARAPGHCRESFGFAEGRLLYGSGPTVPLPVATPEPMRFEVTLRPEIVAVVVPKAARELELLATVNWANNEAVRVSTRVRSGDDGRVQLPFRRGPFREEWFVRTVDEPGVAPGFGFVCPGADTMRIDLQGHRVRIEVRDPQGGPANGARLLLLASPSVSVSAVEVSMPLDRSGRTEVRLGDGAWMLWACDGANSAFRMFRRLAGGEDVRLELQPIPTAVVRFVDAAGRPRARTRLWARVDFDHGRRPDPAALVLGLKVEALGSHVRGWVRLDDEGRLRIPLLVPGATAYLAFLEAPGQPHTKVLIEPGECTVVCESPK